MTIKFNFLRQQPNGEWMGMSSNGGVYFFDESTGKAEYGCHEKNSMGAYSHVRKPVTDENSTKQIADAVIEKKNETD